MRRLLLCLSLTALLAGCSGGGDDSSAEPDATSSISGVQSYDGLKHDHFTKGSDYPHTYTPLPPVGGPHSKAWLACGVYTTTVPNENAVHSLEHGAVWVTYQPDLPAADVAKLAQLQQVNSNYVLVTPYEGLADKVTVSAWGLQLKVDSADDPRLLEFVRTYAGNGLGGEKGADCRNGLTPDKAVLFDKQAQQ